MSPGSKVRNYTVQTFFLMQQNQTDNLMYKQVCLWPKNAHFTLRSINAWKMHMIQFHVPTLHFKVKSAKELTEEKRLLFEHLYTVIF